MGGGVGLVVAGCNGSAQAWEVTQVPVDEAGHVEIDVKDHPGLVTAGGMVALRPGKAKKPVLVQRLEDDKVRVLSLRCPHLGCTVRWDNELQLLRCPCHGSRFDDAGAVLEGPAKQALVEHRSEVSGNRIRFEYDAS